MSKEKSNESIYKDWSSRYMRMRAELVLFSIVLLFITIFGAGSITEISLVFVKFPVDINNHQTAINILIFVMWFYLFLAVWSRWLFERGLAFNNRQLELEIHTYLQEVKQGLLSFMGLKKTIEAGTSATNMLMKRNTKAMEQLLSLGDTDNKIIDTQINNIESLFEKEMAHLRGHVDSLGLIQSEIDKKFKGYDKTLSRIVSKKKWASRGEFMDKNLFGFGVPVIFSIFALLYYFYPIILEFINLQNI
jgi:hypothetical protein